MAAKKVFVDLNVQSGSNVNVQSNLSVTGTSTLKTADLRQVVLTKETYTLPDSPDFFSLSISPDTSVIYLKGDGNQKVLSSVTPLSGQSFANGKRLEIYNNSDSWIELNTSNVGGGSYSFIFEYIYLNFRSDTGYFVPKVYYSSGSEFLGIFSLLKPFESRIFVFESPSNYWRALGQDNLKPDYMIVSLDSQSSFYTNSTTEVVLKISNPFGFHKFNYDISIAANNSSGVGTDYFLSNVSEVLKTQSANTHQDFIITCNKSALELFRGALRYLHFTITL